MPNCYEYSYCNQTRLVLFIQSQVFGSSDSLTPGNYSLYVGDERDGYPFQMVDKSITQMVLAVDINGTIAFITVRPHL